MSLLSEINERARNKTGQPIFKGSPVEHNKPPQDKLPRYTKEQMEADKEASLEWRNKRGQEKASTKLRSLFKKGGR